MSTLRFTKDHEWVRTDGGVATVGITEYAQSALGDVVYVEQPEIGKAFSAGDEAAIVESVKAASEVYAPVSGTVTEANAKLENDPDLLNSDPLGEGWIFKIEMSEPDQTETLMDEAAYTQMIEGLE